MYFIVAEGFKQRLDVLGPEHGLVALNVDVYFRRDGLSDGVDTVCSAGAVGRGEDGWQSVLLGEGEDFARVGGDEYLIDQRAGTGGAIDPGEHGLAGDFAKDFAWHAAGGEARRNDGEGSWGGILRFCHEVSLP